MSAAVYLSSVNSENSGDNVGDSGGVRAGHQPLGGVQHGGRGQEEADPGQGNGAGGQPGHGGPQHRQVRERE